ncbi:MAG: lipoyl(octanoyl) transferase LipB [Bdellovibrionales bacterium]
MSTSKISALEPREEPLVFENWGLLDYDEAMQRQLEYVHRVAEEDRAGYLIFCTHPPVVTLGRATQPGDVHGWRGKVVEVSRGGRATYHGPSQIVVYPILNLKLSRRGRAPREVVGFLRDFEDAIVQTLAHFGIQAQGRSLQKRKDSEADETGVWVQNRKVASLGIAVKKWVTYHGAAVNFAKDSQAFQGLNPCGFQPSVIASVEELAPQTILRQNFEQVLAEKLLIAL